MNKIIREHYDSDDIQRLNMFTDVNKWKSEATFINLENQFYKKLFFSKLMEKTDINLQDLYYLQQELENLDVKNQQFLEKLMAFSRELEGFSECDDLQCETFYLNEIQKFKVDIENYLFDNRNLKTLIYSYINNGLKKLL